MESQRLNGDAIVVVVVLIVVVVLGIFFLFFFLVVVVVVTNKESFNPRKSLSSASAIVFLEAHLCSSLRPVSWSNSRLGGRLCFRRRHHDNNNSISRLRRRRRREITECFKSKSKWKPT